MFEIAVVKIELLLITTEDMFSINKFSVTISTKEVVESNGNGAVIGAEVVTFSLVE